jgi:hypothetical protein
MQSYLAITPRWVAAIFFLLWIEPIRCDVPTMRSEAAQFPPTIVITEGKTGDGFPYLFGGVSSDEREAMEARAKSYNLKLVFAEKRGAFISGAIIMITTAKGTEIDTLTVKGPWFYIQLPPGDYSVKATFKGQTKQINNLHVPKDKRVQQGFSWDLGEE